MSKLALVVIVLGSGVASAAPTFAIMLAEPTVTGALDGKAVDAAIRRAKPQLLACFKKHEKKLVDITGSTTARLRISGDGKVTAVTTTALLEPVETCVKATLSRLAFGTPTDGAAAEVSFLVSYTRDEAGAGYGGLSGTAIGDQSGTSGTLGTIGRSSGGGLGGGPVFRGRAMPTLTFGVPTVKGDLDKAIVRRYLKRQHMRLQHCFEKELHATVGLQGTVTLAFTIGADGRVSMSSATGLGNTNVETCMAGVIKAIEFPKPKSGEVTATYPLALDPGAYVGRTAPSTKAKPAPVKPAPAAPPN